MRIEGHSQSAIEGSQLQKTETPAVSAKTIRDTYSIGEDTASLSSLNSQLSTEPEVRQDVVNSLRTQVENGTYRVSSQAVANAMFQNLFRAN